MREEKQAMSADGRKIAIYARKSKLTETGKSMENQIRRCIRCAEFKFDAGPDEILIYQDEGLSGFYADRPQYLRMLRDIRDDRIRAVICYKFDRISRKTLDLLNLVEQLRQKKIAFISCTDEVDTGSRTGKIMMSLLASIAEFERDIIAERITDNLCELAREGRWLGGTTPTGFVSKKEYMTCGGRRTSVHRLEPVPEEQETVRAIFQQFLERRSVQGVVGWAKENGIRTKNGRAHTRVSIKAILTNPVYAAADGDAFAYFTELGIPVYAEKEAFDGRHGLMAYNKTEQSRELRADSSSASPQYVQRTRRRDSGAWILAIGRHKGTVSGGEWVLTQRILRENRDRFQRPQRKTGALLSGIIVCPGCGKPLYTHRETGRQTGGKPRFLYKCRSKREGKGACGNRPVRGNAADELALDTVCALAGKEERFRALLKQELLSRAAEGKEERESGEAEEAEAGKLIISFALLAEHFTEQEKAELVRTAVEKAYVLPGEDGAGELHIFLKGASPGERGEASRALPVPETRRKTEADGARDFVASRPDLL